MKASRDATYLTDISSHNSMRSVRPLSRASRAVPSAEMLDFFVAKELLYLPYV